VRGGRRVGVGTLYPILHQLEEHGYLTSEQQLGQGRRRRYYQAPRDGRDLLVHIQRKLRELTREALPLG
jgi:PadR family transcriptional regulator, regulatory protein PadR